MKSRRPPKCKGKTASGRRCSRRALADGLCRQHHEKLSGGGRQPDAISADRVARLAELLEAGVALETAASAVGIARRTIYNWLERAEEVDAPEVCVRFAERIEKARSACEADLVERVAKEAREDWKAAAWLLERLFPERYARPSVRPAASARVTQAPGEADRAEADGAPSNVVKLPVGKSGAVADW